MQKSPETVHTVVLYLLQNLFWHLFLSLLGLYISLYLSNLLGLPLIAIAGIALFLILPAIFVKRIQQLFKQKANFTFYEDYFEVKLVGLKNDVVKNTYTNNYTDIDTVKVLTTETGKYSTLQLNFVNGNKKKYLFEENEGLLSQKPQSNATVIYSLINNHRENLLPGRNTIALATKSCSLTRDIITLTVGVILLLTINVLCWFYVRLALPITLVITMLSFIRFYFVFQKSRQERADKN